MLLCRYHHRLQVQRYTGAEKGFYVPHYDHADGTETTRIATFIFYLSDVEEGGETVFPFVYKASGARHGREGFGTLEGQALGHERYEEQCRDPASSALLSVKPAKGSALLFYTLQPKGAVDMHSLHGSCPVARGTKWSVLTRV